MFSAYLGATYFLLKSHKMINKIASIPIFLTFVWLTYVLVNERRIQKEFASGINSEAIFGYVVITIMTVTLIVFASGALRRSN